jgi:hypothetical protein
MFRNTKNVPLAQPAVLCFKHIIRLKAGGYNPAVVLPVDKLNTVYTSKYEHFEGERAGVIRNSIGMHDELIPYGKDLVKQVLQYNYEDIRHLYSADIQKYYDDIAKKDELLYEELMSYNSVMPQIMRDYTYFEKGMEDWNITLLIRAAELSSVDVFIALVQDACPFNMGHFGFNENRANTTKQDFIKLLETTKAANNNYVYIDYWNGIGVKSRFPVDIMKSDQCITIRRYNERNGGTGYERICKLITPVLEKLLPTVMVDEDTDTAKTQLGDFRSSIGGRNNPCGTEPLLYGNIEPLTYDKSRDDDANSQIKPDTPRVSEEYLWDQAINLHNASYCSHRESATTLWPYQMPDKCVSDNPAYFSLAHAFIFSEGGIYGSLYVNRIKPEDLSIVNALIYGKVNINMSILERLIPLIRVKITGSKSLQLDNYVIIYEDWPQFGKPRYTIKWCEDNMDELYYISSEEDRKLVGQGLYQLMNETDPAKLNFNNYFHVCAWVSRVDFQILTIQSFMNKK